ncbi:hypothetical protein [Phenylobacterium sp.]|uniref:hypothetical protein n=1 Tax=Phenylobacterium sp. TaxID=1871053 RepID=UPI002BD6B400|nr:hypothetical protein [Phenylobacterium sp.]HVI30832.1 hypothetical protein [Phenylobacterium sp.]
MAELVRASVLLRQLPALLAVVALACVLGFYLNRVFAPLPLYAGDEGAYLIRALYPPEAAAKDPAVPELANGFYFLVARLVRALSFHYLPWLRLIGLVAYIGGVLLVWRATTPALPRPERLTFLLLALAFPYYRFVVTALPEGLYVLLLALLAWATAGLYRRRPLVHAGLAGALCAALVLTKPHGLAVVAGLAALIVLEGLSARRPGLAGLRLAVSGAVFLAAGNAIQALAHQPVASPLRFFVGPFYDAALSGAPAPGAFGLAALAAAGMAATVALFAGPPIVAGVLDIAQRRRAGQREAEGTDLVFVLLLLSLAATVAMVTVFAFKISVSPGETKRIWGRYFEFFVPLLWLAAAPSFARLAGRRPVGLASAGVMLAGLAGLYACFAAGVVLYAWDGGALTAFFKPHPERALITVRLPYREIATALTLAAAAALALKMRPGRVGAAYVLALAVVSTQLDDFWIGPMAGTRAEFAAEVRGAGALLSQGAGRGAIFVKDNNDAHLSFLALDGQVQIAMAPPEGVDAAAAAPYGRIVTVRDLPGPPGWRPIYQGWQLKVWEKGS